MTIEDIMNRIPVYWGKWVDVGPGWYDLIVRLDEDIAKLDPNYTIAQVKEKFGGLRYYIDTINPDVAAAAQLLVGAAERKSEETCEVCGEPGELSTKTSWYKTVCPEHLDKPPRGVVE